MNQSSEFNRNGDAQNLQIWRCDNCEAVHFKAGNVLLNFTKTEFAELTYAVNDVFQDEFGSLEFFDLINSLNDRNEILTSELIS